MSDEGARRRQAALAGHTNDLEAAKAALRDPAPAVRSTALGALARLGALDASVLAAGLVDAATAVRRRACEIAATAPLPGAVPLLIPVLADPDVSVVEAAAWALGERGASEAVDVLCDVATGHDDPLCREAAVAALGAIGDRRGLTAILAACSDKPAVRRRAVLALAPFEGDEVEAALERAALDRDWQVRQAADDLRRA